MRIAPLTEVVVDLICPWKIKVNGRVVEFNALTCIDTASNLIKLIRIDEKTPVHVTKKSSKFGLRAIPLGNVVYITWEENLQVVASSASSLI